jgi:hypothetical protein
MISKLNKVVKNPSLAYNYLQRKIQSFLSVEYVGSKKNRSDSDDYGFYVSAVQDIVRKHRLFEYFKRNPDYKSVLEHVSFEQGVRYFEIIKATSPDFFNNKEVLKENDQIGNPYIFEYPEIGAISPTTLRYFKVASDLRHYFGDQIGERIVEIGVGYGGQALVNDRIFDITEYELIDLSPVLNLVSKYLENHILRFSYKLSTLNQKTGLDNYDLIISNYAFSELPSNLQLMYIKKILTKSKRGYITMNSGLGKSIRSKGKLSIAELRGFLPPSIIIEEDPLTGPENFILIWGHKSSSEV